MAILNHVSLGYFLAGIEHRISVNETSLIKMHWKKLVRDQPKRLRENISGLFTQATTVT